MRNYEVIAPFGTVIKTALTKREAQKMVREAWAKEHNILYWREIGSNKKYIA